MNIASIFRLSTFIRLLIVLATHALRNEEPTRKIKLGENIRFITEVLSVNRDATFFLPISKINNHSDLFLLGDDQVLPHDQLGTVLRKRWFQEHHRQLM